MSESLTEKYPALKKRILEAINDGCGALACCHIEHAFLDGLSAGVDKMADALRTEADKPAEVKEPVNAAE